MTNKIVDLTQFRDQSNQTASSTRGLSLSRYEVQQMMGIYYFYNNRAQWRDYEVYTRDQDQIGFGFKKSAQDDRLDFLIVKEKRSDGYYMYKAYRHDQHELIEQSEKLDVLVGRLRKKLEKTFPSTDSGHYHF